MIALDPYAMLRKAHGAFLASELDTARRILLALIQQIGEQPDPLHLLALVERDRGEVEASDRAFARATAQAPAREGIYEDWAKLHRTRGAHGRAETILCEALSRFPTSRSLLSQLGFLKREMDERDAAADLFDRVLALGPPDPIALHARARIELERGGDARSYYAKALSNSPVAPDVILGAAASLHREGETNMAIALLNGRLKEAPDWMEGLTALARIRWESGAGRGFTAGYRDALERRPADPRLWAAYLGTLSSSRFYDEVLAFVGEARQRAGDHPLFTMIEAEALSESGQSDAAEQAFRRLEPIKDHSLVPARMRHLLRSDRAAQAAELGECFTQGLEARFIWPLLALAWRVLGDPKWEWLERYEDTVRQFDLSELIPYLPAFTELLSRLHHGRAHPYDQSPRGGTQTDGELFARTEPLIVATRKAVAGAVREYIDGLPPIEADHPFLGRARGPFRFSGSWSIRLSGNGFHVNHVHPEGWISSALYIALPDKTAEIDPHAGWLKLGEPPSELGLALPAVRFVEPACGRLVLFPSIMWHGTVPFARGVRLTTAFDVVPSAA